MFDVAHVIEQSRKGPIATSFAGQCEFAAGSFFDGVPKGADAYIMKHIIHDWDEERATKILFRMAGAVRSVGFPPGTDHPYAGAAIDFGRHTATPRVEAAPGCVPGSQRF